MITSKIGQLLYQRDGYRELGEAENMLRVRDKLTAIDSLFEEMVECIEESNCKCNHPVYNPCRRCRLMPRIEELRGNE
jgi:hypothetical protein